MGNQIIEQNEELLAFQNRFSFKIPEHKLPADPVEAARIKRIVHMSTVCPGGVTIYRHSLPDYLKMYEEAIQYIDDSEGILIRGCDEGQAFVHLRILRTGINA